MTFKIEKQFSYRKIILDTPNFKKYIKSLPKWKQLLISEYTESKRMDPLITYIQSKKKLVIASDGSKSNTTSGGAWIISNEEGGEILSGYIPDFGDISQINSHRAELFGTLAVLLFLREYS